MVGKTTAGPRDVHVLRHLQPVPPTWQKDLGRHLINEGFGDGEINLDSPDGPKVMKKSSYKRKRKAGKSLRVREGFEDALLLVLRMEEGAMSQGMQAVSSWKKQENIFCP